MANSGPESRRAKAQRTESDQGIGGEKGVASRPAVATNSGVSGMAGLEASDEISCECEPTNQEAGAQESLGVGVI